MARLLLLAVLAFFPAQSSSKIASTFERWLGRKMGEPSTGDIDPARGAFVRLSKEALSNVPEIARLPETAPP